MNRRKVLKSLFGIGLIGAAAPALSEAQRKRTPAPVALPPMGDVRFEEYPLDLRTPEQLLEDEDKWIVDQFVEYLRPENTKHYRGIHRVNPRVFNKAKVRLTEAQRPFELIQLDGKEAIVLYGSVLTTFTNNIN